MSLSRRIARPMLSAIFIAEGIDVLRNPGPRVKTSEDVTLKLASTLGLPQSPELLVKINAGVHVGAGTMLALGKFRRLSALALIGSLIPTTYAGHRFWERDDPQERAQQRTHFLKNVGLIGGLILELVDTEGSPSLGWRARRAARSASEAVSIGSGAGSARTSELRGRAAKQASKAAKKVSKQAAKNATRLASVSSDRAGELWSTGSAAAGEALSTGSHQAGQLLGAGSERAGQLLGASSERAGQLLGAGSERAGELWSTGSAVTGDALSTGSRQAGQLLGAGSERAGELLSVGARRAGEALHTAADRLPQG